MPPGRGIAGAEQLHGKELSYNNLVDLDACWQLVCEFSGPAAAIIKHTNPAGCAEQSSLAEAYRKALECDPVSAFGGVIGIESRSGRRHGVRNGEAFRGSHCRARLFRRGACNPAGEEESAPRPRDARRTILWSSKASPADFSRRLPIAPHFDRSSCEVKTRRAPTDEEWRALEFGWKVVKHVKSNAIVYARPGQTAAVGAGQMSRVDSVNIGAMKAHLPLAGTVVASDAYFPFPDGLEQAAQYGATAFIQPGGSVNDAEVIAAADRLDLAMVFTGVRHFRH